MENTRDVDIDIEKGEIRHKEEEEEVSSRQERLVDGEEDKKQIVVVNEKRKKRASRPPRHPRGLSLDAADQKLIREIKQLALLKKRERFNKVKPSNNTSLGVVFAFLFFFLILIQGMRSSSTTPSSSLTYFQEISPAESLRKSKKGYLISVGYASSINSVVDDRPASSEK